MKKGRIIGMWVLIFAFISFKSSDLMEDKKRFEAVQLRVARPTNKLKEVTEFYQKAVGLEKVGSFENHEGYDGVMLGLNGIPYHLEFTQHIDGSPCPAPTKDNLLVFYFDSPDKYKQAVNRMQKFGAIPVDPENPYWKDKSLTFEDPDGWRVVLFNGVYKILP
jgi:uncharacterized glyoxalase superfamily protein PhnB